MVLPAGGQDAALVALHAEDGHIVWATGSDAGSYCPAFPISFQGRRCVVGYLQNALIVVELATGKLLCRRELSAGYDEHSAWPLYQEPDLLLTGPFRALAVQSRLQAAAPDTLTSKPRWSSRELSNDILSSVLYQNHIYGFDLKQQQASKHRASRGVFRCLDWVTGKTRWSTDQVGHASVLAADGKLILLNDTGSLILARADPDAFQELGRAQLFEDEICWTPPTLWKGRLFARNPSRVICCFVGRPEDLPDGSVTTPPAEPSRSWRWDSSWLLTRERDFPNDAPSWEEMTLWFTSCLLLLVASVLLATGLKILSNRLFGRNGAPALWPVVFVLGFLGPSALSALADRCIFTWPLSLYAAFHLTVQVSLWARSRPNSRQAGWYARLAILGLLLVAYAYFELCKFIGMFIAWTFLIGFLPASPFTFLAVRAADKQKRLFAIAWTLVAVTAFFWSAQALLLWKQSQLGR
ncbi:MAG: PQQ-binding-like beta-propeller repeat protein [Planctomycetes bacterium]|nr:PQQ-binding-like beta-propeller repeat protein [Planctomycetota bacterium]